MYLVDIYFTYYYCTIYFTYYLPYIILPIISLPLLLFWFSILKYSCFYEANLCTHYSNISLERYLNNLFTNIELLLLLKFLIQVTILRTIFLQKTFNTDIYITIDLD